MNTGSNKRQYREGLKAARFLMVLGSLSPLFILWAIRGNSLIPDFYFVVACVLMAGAPTVFLWLRIRTAQKDNDIRELTAGTSEDHRSHVLIYLFAILLPFYREELASYRDLAAMIVALGFIVFLFWHLNLHYMNVYFAFMRYQIFTVSPPQNDNPHTGCRSFVLITQRGSLSPGDRVRAYRLSNTVYLEEGS